MSILRSRESVKLAICSRNSRNRDLLWFQVDRTPDPAEEPRPFTAIGYQRQGQYNRLSTHTHTHGGAMTSARLDPVPAASETQTDLTRHPVCVLCNENTRTHTPILSAKLGEGACIVCQLGGSSQGHFVTSYSAALRD